MTTLLTGVPVAAMPSILGGRLPTDEPGEVVDAYGLGSFPFAAVVAVLFVIVLLRAQATYWLGRGLTAGTIRSGVGAAIERRLSGPGLARAATYLNRWGPFAVTLCFLTIGIQTLVNLAAGLTRMPFVIYTAAMVPGCVAWAFIYATIGMTAFYAAVAAAAGSLWGIAVLVAAAAGITILVLRRRRLRAARQAAGDAPV